MRGPRDAALPAAPLQAYRSSANFFSIQHTHPGPGFTSQSGSVSTGGPGKEKD